MTKDNRNGSKYLAIAALVLVCTVLGTLGGAVAGGVAGYLLASHEVSALAPRPGAQLPRDIWRILPRPGNPRWPETPLIPPDRRFDWPEGRPPSRMGISAEVTTVVAGSPAEAADLQPGDRITAVDGRELSFSRDLAQTIAGRRPGDQVELTVARADSGEKAEEELVNVRLGQHPDDPARPYLGLIYRMVFNAQHDGPRLESGGIGQ